MFPLLIISSRHSEFSINKVPFTETGPEMSPLLNNNSPDFSMKMPRFRNISKTNFSGRNFTCVKIPPVPLRVCFEVFVLDPIVILLTFMSDVKVTA